tara:strand:+ start:148 stop:798 length:651 start_codon:yes stop_codon:yes gene_type:complete
MNNFYTYAYLREDGKPYYIGKGSGNRIYRNNGRACRKPRDKSKIIFLKQNLTEEESFKHEVYMIAVFGRKDLGTGILHNKSNGGEGATGVIRTEEQKRKMSEERKGEKCYWYGKKFSKEHREKMSLKRKGKPLSKEHKEKISLGWKNTKKKPLTKEHKENISKGLSKRVWIVKCPNGEIVKVTNLSQFCRENNLNNSHLSIRKKSKGFMLLETCQN